MKFFENKVLLVISNGFPTKEGFPNHTFVKAQVDELSNYFKRVIVVSPQPYFPKIFSSVSFFKRYVNKSFFKDYSYDNVEVFFPKYFTLPINFFRKRNGDLAYHVAFNCIKKNKLNFDLIHSHFTWTSGFVGVKLKKMFNKKLFLTVHENREWFLKEYNSKDNNLINVWKNSDLIFRVNEIDLPLLKKYNKNSISIPNGYDDLIFKKINNNLRSKMKLSSSKKILLNVSSYRICHKNQINLIKAINELTKERDDFILFLIGDGEDREKIEKKIEELKLGKYIKFLGPKPHSQIPQWMNVADLFVLPSYSEGNPTVMFESLGCGLPFIGTDVGGVGEIIKSDDYGLIYSEPDDYKKLAFLINKGLNKSWDEKKILKYSKSYTWKKLINQVVEVYRNEIKK